MSSEALVGKTLQELTESYGPNQVDELLTLIQRAFDEGTSNESEIQWNTETGERILDVRHVPEKDATGNVVSVLSIARDVTELKQAEEELRASETRFRTFVENAADAFFLHEGDELGTVLDVNRQACESLGYRRDELIGRTTFDFDPNINHSMVSQNRKRLDAGEALAFETHHRRKDGSVFPVEIRIRPFWQGEHRYAVSLARDITERKQAEDEHQAHLRFLESMDQVNRAIQGTNDLNQMMSDVLEAILTIFDCDRAGLIYPCDPEATSWYVSMEKTRPEFPGAHILEGEIPMDPDVAQKQRTMRTLNGPVKFGPGSEYPLPTEVSQRFGIQSLLGIALYPKVGEPWEFMLQQCSYERTWTPEEERLFQEIGRRLSDSLSTMISYRNLQESEERYRQLVEISPDAIVLYRQGHIEFVNPAALHLAGVKNEDNLIGRSVSEFIQPDYRENVEDALENLQKTGESALFVEENFLRADGVKIDVEVAIVPYQFQGENYIQILARDITVRKQHEREREAIIKVSTALRQARTRTEILSVILDQLVDLFDADGAVLALPDPKTEGYFNEMGCGTIGERMVGLHIPPGKGVCNWVITKKRPYLNNRADQDSRFYRTDLLGNSHCLVAAPLIAQEKAIGALLIVRKTDFIEPDLNLLAAIADIAANAIHRVTLHEQTEQQLQRLIALHQIDLAISSNYDLTITLNVLLGSVKDELEVDAASVLLLNPVTHTLDYTAGIGFRTNNIEQSRVRIGNGCAGHAAQELRTISCVEIGEGRGILVRSSLLASEEFVSHYATPLVIKGQIKGVLEVFHRQQMEPEQTWISYFETLATQAAIAIENTSLLENLQRSNTELTLAYDATIEGWSRALDLRDRETEGHTQRVAEMALELAKKMGMSEAEKKDLRRGALLHDIGKMGVPDVILHKHGALSKEEWEIMRQHPQYAYQMLAPIEYLKRAMEIPYCHHEKWDGSGYPRGLKGDEIPLSARVFTVIDVFDALTSDRPYRKAWSREKAYQYIQEQKGTFFDPKVTDTFLKIR
jgi:PAS domain S-box-containing protein/putative nucleotidyltransferase with HDIG domain